jgi:geranylgeranylglyceryl phosphate synthase family protein
MQKCSRCKGRLFFCRRQPLVITNRLDEVILQIKKNCNIPVLLFPGSPSQISRYGDALLYLSLISGRNADLLIGQHVISAPFIRQSGLEIISTGYMVVDGGSPTTVSYISNALPLPADKHEIAMCTAIAGEMLGMKLIYMDADVSVQRFCGILCELLTGCLPLHIFYCWTQPLCVSIHYRKYVFLYQ